MCKNMWQNIRHDTKLTYFYIIKKNKINHKFIIIIKLINTEFLHLTIPFLYETPRCVIKLDAV